MRRWLGLQLIALSAIAIVATPNFVALLEDRYGSSQSPGQTSVYFKNADLSTRSFSAGTNMQIVINNEQASEQHYRWTAYLSGHSFTTGEITVPSKQIMEFVVPALHAGKLEIKFEGRRLILKALVK